MFVLRHLVVQQWPQKLGRLLLPYFELTYQIKYVCTYVFPPGDAHVKYHGVVFNFLVWIFDLMNTATMILFLICMAQWSLT